MSMHHLFNAQVDIKRPVAGYGDMGGVEYALSDFASSALCRISEGDPRDNEVGPSEYAEANITVYTAPGLAVQRDDEIHHGDRIFTVVGVTKPSADGFFEKLICTEKSRGA